MINLLPPELAPSSRAAKFARLIRNAVIIGFSLFIIVVVGSLSFFIINTIDLQASRSRQDTLKNTIKSLEVTETRLVLVQDRVKLAKTILAEPSAQDSLQKLSSLLPSLSTGTTLSEAEISADKTKFSVTTSDSLDMAKFMAAVVAGDLYEKVDLVSFGYNPTSGYLSSFETEVK